MFSLFNKIKTEEVFSMVRTKLLWWNTKGIPAKEYRTKDNYYENKSNFVNKKECSFGLCTKKDGLDLEFRFCYNKKTKKASFCIYAFGLNLMKSKEGMKMIREKYNMFNFWFVSFTQASFPERKCKTQQEIFTYLKDGMAAWNTCELYSLFVDLKKLLYK